MKLKEIVAITIVALAFMLITGVAKSDDTIDTKVKNHIVKEWNDIKEYQTKTWAEAKTKWPWNVLLKGNNDTQN
jgi:hypothetical protein|tara:strand:- start:522 stop:743 length:222 start_codon:yes stop_codon:yes gene_type:complete